MKKGGSHNTRERGAGHFSSSTRDGMRNKAEKSGTMSEKKKKVPSLRARSKVKSETRSAVTYLN